MGRWHAQAIKRAHGQLVAVADPDLTAAERIAVGQRGVRVFSDVEQMLAQTSLDVLHICAPLPAHYRLTELAIAAGLHALIEKPLTPRAAETARLFDLAAARNVVICPVHQFLFQDGAKQAFRSVSGIGRLAHIQGEFHSAGGTGQAGEQLEAIAADILPHPLALMQRFLLSDLAAAAWQVARPAPGELYALGEAAGVALSINISLNSRPTVCALRLYGERGTIHLDLFHGYAVIEPGQVSRARKLAHPFDLALRSLAAATINLGKRIIRRQPAYPGLQRLVREFYQAAQNGTAPPISRAEAIVVARVRDHLLALFEVNRQAPQLLDEHARRSKIGINAA